MRLWRPHNEGPSVVTNLPSLKSDLFQLKKWHADFNTCDVTEMDGGYLDHHLRNASHIQRQLLKLLNGLKESICDSGKILKGQTVPWDKLSDEELKAFKRLNTVGEVNSSLKVPIADKIGFD
ncbi:hypothetical protein BDP55DRAFT_750586 [Colletotrichum godetiae]|uniref:Uncharacterized protein n=1 Tax=Colletotrichum godetiae TaxID=1209918 RepID=A0AAJ0AHK1_9PEZI|nr:uncharacterized protein BDP55DRAFT_750586 [Colletotrichum godetiae]KAK1672482.1 hypothetical protein BDP55DRAFT_750586 [Colletotrichum godetiae]